jgi:hypothetical protein
MTPQQRVALDHPCRLGMETAHPRFGRVLLAGGRWWVVALTINSGYE